MPNYNEQTINGAQTYQRAKQITVSNPYPGTDTPSVVFTEEKAYLFDNELAFRADLGEVKHQITDFYASFPLLDLATDYPLEMDMTYGQMYLFLYSAYRFYGSKRDFPIPVLRIYPPQSKAEGEQFTFKVWRWGDLSLQATVDWAVSGTGETPADADDFGGTFPSGSLTFAENEYLKTITFSSSEDADIEGNETFKIELSNPDFCTIDIGSVTVTITNDDA